MKVVKILVTGVLALGLAGCMSDAQFKERVAKTLKSNPEILGDAIKEKPAEFIEAFQEAVKKAQGEMAKKREEEETKQLETTFDKPLAPSIRSDAMLGRADAPLTLTEYSDFECPFCSRGFQTVEALRAKYGDKIRFQFKHLPLSFHKNAMITAQYFEAIRLQSVEKAYKFHDKIFTKQEGLKQGEAFLKATAKAVGADMGKVAKALNSDVVKNRIAEDMAEAQKFGMEGTPGFVLNGVPVKGAYPKEYFEQIVEKLIQKGKLKL